VQEREAWDVRYEWRAILLLTIGFGLVGLDRFAINPLFPSMMKDLNLNYQDLGNISAILSLAWGVSSMYMGQMSDRIGRRKVLIPAVLVFSCMAGFTGLATGIGSLLFLRVIMGLSEGAFMPPSIAACIEASKPSRRAFNFGVQQNGFPLIGLALGPIIATQLLQATGSWRVVFVIVSLPGLILAYFMYKIIRDPKPVRGAPIEPSAAQPRWRDALRHRNVVLACIILSFIAGALNVVLAMTPSYLVDYLKVEPQRMGFIMSMTGIGAVVGGLTLPALSDRFGRKPVMLGCSAAAAFAMWFFMMAPDQPIRLFLLLATVSSVVYINNGPLTMESVPAPIASTAVGLVVGIGEIIGGGIAPALAGYIAQNFGIQHVFNIALASLIAAAVFVFFLREPSKLGQVQASEQAA
jgi:MFS family permease